MYLKDISTQEHNFEKFASSQSIASVDVKTHEHDFQRTFQVLIG